MKTVYGLMSNGYKSIYRTELDRSKDYVTQDFEYEFEVDDENFERLPFENEMRELRIW